MPYLPDLHLLVHHRCTARFRLPVDRRDDSHRLEKQEVATAFAWSIEDWHAQDTLSPAYLSSAITVVVAHSWSIGFIVKAEYGAVYVHSPLATSQYREAHP